MKKLCTSRIIGLAAPASFVIAVTCGLSIWVIYDLFACINSVYELQENAGPGVSYGAWMFPDDSDVIKRSRMPIADNTMVREGTFGTTFWTIIFWELKIPVAVGESRVVRPYGIWSDLRYQRLLVMYGLGVMLVVLVYWGSKRGRKIPDKARIG